MKTTKKEKLMMKFASWYEANEEKYKERYTLAKKAFCFAQEAIKIMEVEEMETKRKRKSGEIIIEDFLKGSNVNDAYNAIFYDAEGYKVVTEGHYLVAIKDTIPEERKGKIISPDGQEIDKRFPAWRNVLPDLEKYVKSGMKKEDFLTLASLDRSRSFSKMEEIRIEMKENDFYFHCNMLNIKLALKFWESFPEAELFRENITFQNEAEKEAEDRRLYSDKTYCLKYKENTFLFMPLSKDCPLNYKYDAETKDILKVED